jgi:uncharacterized repeat protein (TIGR03803 family)
MIRCAVYSSLRTSRVTFFAAINIFAASPAAAWTEKIIYSHGYIDSNFHQLSAQPEGGLISDSAGNLYGTTVNGGDRAVGGGVAYALTPPASTGSWSLQQLYQFDLYNEGASSMGRLLLAKDGTLYGTTYISTPGNGGIFSLNPPSVDHPAWAETTLHHFLAKTDGTNPRAGLITDSASNLYGMTAFGGSKGYGAVYMLEPPRNGGTAWTRTIIHSFTSGIGGTGRDSELVMDRSGNLYGAAANGTASAGLIFRLSPPPAGKTAWVFGVLHNFSYSSGPADPNGLAIDGNDRIFGTAIGGGKSGHGAIFSLNAPKPGSIKWTVSTLYAFKGGIDGAEPFGTLQRDPAGALYGVSRQGSKNRGTVFKLDPPALGTSFWTKTTLHVFLGGKSDGDTPNDGLVIDNAGRVYGTTFAGGLFGVGTVFEIDP